MLDCPVQSPVNELSLAPVPRSEERAVNVSHETAGMGKVYILEVCGS